MLRKLLRKGNSNFSVDGRVTRLIFFRIFFCSGECMNEATGWQKKLSLATTKPYDSLAESPDKEFLWKVCTRYFRSKQCIQIEELLNTAEAQNTENEALVQGLLDLKDREQQKNQRFLADILSFLASVKPDRMYALSLILDLLLICTVLLYLYYFS